MTPKNQANLAIAMPDAQGMPSISAELARFNASGDEKLSPRLEEWMQGAEQQAKNLVGTTFFAQMLKQMRDSPFKSDLFDGGRGGQAYAGMYDQQLSTRMAQRLGDGIARPIVRKFAGQKAYDAYAKQRKEATNVAHDQRA